MSTPKERIDDAIREQLDAVDRDAPNFPDFMKMKVDDLKLKIAQCRIFYNPERPGEVIFRDWPGHE